MKRERGFALIELVLVISILGVLTAIALPQFSKHRTTAYNMAAMSDLKNAVIAQEAYYTDHGVYAGSAGMLSANCELHFSDGVIIPDASFYGDSDSYHMEAYHPNGNKVYQIDGPGGSIEAKY